MPHPNLAYLFGAGVSVPANLPTALGLVDKALKAVEETNETTAYQYRRSLNFVIAAMRLHDIRTNANAGAPIGIERLVSAVELLANRNDLEVAPFIRSWDPLVEDLERSINTSDSAARSFVNTITQQQPSRTPYFSRPSRAASELVRAIKETVRHDSRPVFNELHGWLTERLIEDLVITETTQTDYLLPLVLSARKEGAVLATLNYDLAVEICAREAGISLNRMVDDWSTTGSLNEGGPGLPYIKLHGSVDWSTRDGDDLVIGGSQEDRGSPALVYGQREKLRSGGPFLQLLDLFRRSLAGAERLIVSGYSFGDEHVNAIIRRWMATTPTAKLLVVDPSFPDLFGWALPQQQLWGRYGTGPNGFGSSGDDRSGVERDRMFVRREGIADFAAQLDQGTELLFDNSGLSTDESRSMAEMAGQDK